MKIPRPTPAQLSDIADELGLSLSDADIDVFAQLIDGALAGSCDIIDRLPNNLPEVRYPRTPGYRPEGEENAYNAWAVKCHIKGQESGKLAGKKIALKDTVCVAGVPLMNGTSVLEGYLPDVDATIVTRMLDAGGEIVGKANTESFSLSGSSHTSVLGPVQNPHKKGYSAGGSSSGCSALVAAGEVDMAIGCDQAGSLRIPSSACGIYGMKQTYGLVPYTGILSQEFNVDHAGPMTATVADNALLLEVLAGGDGIDPRQGGIETAPYTEAIGGGASGLRIGILREGFGFDHSDPDVDATVRRAAEQFEKLGASVEEVSVPMHLIGAPIWRSFAIEGYYQNILMGNGFGTNHGGLYVTGLNDALAAWRSGRANEFPPHFVMRILLATHVSRTSRGHVYGKAINIARRLRAAYDVVLAECDLLLLPTFTVKPNRLPEPDIGIAEYVEIAFRGVVNTPSFNLTYHPAMTVPCGKTDGLPIGMMLVGRHFDESTIYRAAHAFEQACDWQTM